MVAEPPPPPLKTKKYLIGGLSCDQVLLIGHDEHGYPGQFVFAEKTIEFHSGFYSGGVL